MPEDQHDELGRLARVVAGSPDGAAELLGEVAVLSRRSPVHGDDDGYEERRALLVQRVLRRRATSAARTDPVASDPADPSSAEPPSVVARLAQLEPLARTLLVLRHGEHLTLAELARITDRSPSAIQRALEQAEAATDASTEPGQQPLQPYEIEQALWNAEAPAPGAVREVERRFGARRRRTRFRVVLASLAAVALVVGLTALPGLRTDPYVRAYGEWTSAVQLPAQPRFTFQARQLTASEEVLSVIITETEATCSVTVTTARARIPVPAGRPTKVSERVARFVDATDETDPGLWWSVGPRTSAEARCDEQPEDALLVELAELVQFAPGPVRVPFDFRDLPSSDEVHTFLDYSGTTAVLVTPRGQNEESPDAVFVGLVSRTAAAALSGRRVDINGDPGQLSDDEDQTTLC
ncbi:RNA polymerase sigma factor [uncultured Friedmanniella sp.]|uniref:RNA polymerase sigma factor n=1 Tax=uncultured Friedmanniella sp. TaxID=335381 RepID=UPI0035CBA80F